MDNTELNELAKKKAKDLKKCESELLELLVLVEHRRLWEKLGYVSLVQYAEEELELSYDNASNFSRVAKKSMEVPDLYQAIEEGKLSVSTARRIVAVINEENCEEWIEKAATLKQTELQREIAKDNPRAARPDSVKHVAEDVLELQAALSPEAAQVLERVQEVESQRTGKPCTLNDAILAMGKLYLEKKDPMKKAERNIGKPTKKSVASRRRPQAQTQHAVMLTDNGQCRFILPNGKRCHMRKWLEAHHHNEWAKGGGHELDNLGLYCKYHHRFLHGHAHSTKATPPHCNSGPAAEGKGAIR